MKKLLLITGLCLHTALQTSAAARNEDPLTLGKKGRVLVRMSSQATSDNPESNAIMKSKPNKPKPEPKEGIYSGWRFIGFPPEVRANLDKALLRLKNEAPVHYKMAIRQVRSFTWRQKGGSFAYCRQGHITLGGRDYFHSTSWFIITLIHEIQHCNWPGNENEDGACYAGWYYGTQLKLSPYLCAYSKSFALKRGYTAEKWEGNLRVTRRMNAGSPK